MESISFTRTVSGVSNTFANSFGYEIVASETNPAPVMGLVNNFRIDFTETDEIVENSVSSSTIIDLSGVVFSKLGDYEFTVREVSSTDEVNFPVDKSNEYTLMASVRNALDETGKPTGELEASFLTQVKNTNGEKSENALFENTAIRSKLEMSNSLQGSMADGDAYFKYKLSFVGAKQGDVFTISGQDAEVSYGGETIATATTVIVGQDNYIYLKHGQTVTIGNKDGLNELPIGIQYRIEELDMTDYETYIDGVLNEDKVSELKTVQAELAPDASEELVVEFEKNNKTSFVNKKEASVLTGVTLGILPFVAIAVFGGVGYLATRRFARK